MANSTFRPMAQSPLQILAQPQSNDALMASILAQQVGSKPQNLGDAFLNLANLYLAGKMNTRANEGDMARRQASDSIVQQVLGGNAPQDANTAAQASVIANPASIPPQQPESASVVPVERSPLAPPVGNMNGSMAGAMPPDGGPALGSMVEGDISPPAQMPVRVADAMPPAGHAMAVPGFQNIDGQLQSNTARLRQLQQAQGILATGGVSDPRIEAEIKRIEDANKTLESRRDMLFREQGDQSRADARLAFDREKEGRQQAKDDIKFNQEQEAKAKSAEREKQIAGQTITEIDRAIGILDNDKGVSIGGVEIPFTDAAASGPAAGLMGMVPFTDANRLKTLLQGIAEKTGFKALLEAKSSSATGASGFGALSAPELKLLQNAYANLEQTQDPQVLRSNLMVVRDLMAKAVGEESQSPATPQQKRLRFNPETGDFE